MSHTLYPMRHPRLQRSELAVPGSNPSFIEKAADGPADYVFLDLEDAVAPMDKEQARKNVIVALNEIDWAAKGKTVSVRINGLDTHYMYRDLVDVMEQAGQVQLANEVFSPPYEEVTKARRIIEALREAEAQGKGPRHWTAR